MMAGFGHYKVIAVDYRMPPEALFPAALDDAITVYKSVTKTTDPKNVGDHRHLGRRRADTRNGGRGQAGRSADARCHRARHSDVGRHQDGRQFLHERVRRQRSRLAEPASATTPPAFYAAWPRLKDPLLSPVYADMTGFPPTILTTGTRDQLLSNTVRVHRKLRRAGVEADLNVYEGESHAQYQFDDRVPETKEAFGDIAAFFGKHLGK